MYVLEVQEKIPHKPCASFKHVGYMNRIFGIREEAARFYSIYNPHMRVIHMEDILANYSDWDIKDNRRYVVRHSHGEVRSIESWDGYESEGLSSTGWSEKVFTALGQDLHLGEPMTTGPGEPMAEFPLCGGDKCWCFDCAMDSNKLSGYGHEEDKYDEFHHKLTASLHAKCRYDSCRNYMA